MKILSSTKYLLVQWFLPSYDYHIYLVPFNSSEAKSTIALNKELESEGSDLHKSTEKKLASFRTWLKTTGKKYKQKDNLKINIENKISHSNYMRTWVVTL